MGEGKMRLEQLRGTIHIDIPGTAAAAGVPTSTVYFMLIRQPVGREEAEKVLNVLSTPERSLSLKNVDVVLWEDFLILYCARATDEVHFEHDQFHFTYARDEQHARDVSQAWIDQVTMILPAVYFTPIPTGLVIGDMIIPGKKSASQKITETA